MKHLKNILFILLAVSCVKTNNKEQEDLISKEKMVDIYLDIRILEAAKFQSLSDSTIFQKGVIQYEDIFRKHKVEASKVKETHKYYLRNSEQLAWIYERVEERLHSEKNKLEAAQEGGSRNILETK